MQLHRQRFVSLQHEVNASTVSLVGRAVQREGERETERERQDGEGCRGKRGQGLSEGKGERGGEGE